MRALGVDFGERRIGLAVSDETGAVVVPVGVVLRTSDAGAVRDVAAAAREREVAAVVVGLPRLPSGDEGPMARRARSFARKLAEASGLAVELQDEALTSAGAESALRESGLGPAARAAARDAEAAAAILRDWLGRRTEGAAAWP